MSLIMPVRVSGMDADGLLFEEQAGTIDVTTTGARLSGIRHPLYRGGIVSVQRGPSKARFRVMWVGEAGGPDHGEIGIQLVESGKLIWGQVIPRIFGDMFRSTYQQPASCQAPLPSQELRNTDRGVSE